MCRQVSTKRPIAAITEESTQISATKCVHMLAFTIGLYRISHNRDPNAILMKHVVALLPIRVLQVTNMEAMEVLGTSHFT